jgi:N-acetyltransferase
VWDLAPTLRGQLVTLEPLTESHRETLWPASRPPEIWDYWPFNPGRTPEAYDAWFNGALADPAADPHGPDGLGTGSAFHFATLDARTGAGVGSTSFCTPRPADRGIEIGWTWVTSSAWGTGVNTEAKLLQLTYAFETLDCLRVEFDTDQHNARSRAALTRLGAHFEGVLRDWRIDPDGSVRSSAYFSVLAREWPDVQAQLRARLRT